MIVNVILYKQEKEKEREREADGQTEEISTR